MVGENMVGRNGGTPEQYAQAAMAVQAMTGDELTAIPVIEYKEQCVLLSRASTLAAYSRSLDNTKIADEDRTDGSKEFDVAYLI